MENLFETIESKTQNFQLCTDTADLAVDGLDFLNEFSVRSKNESEFIRLVEELWTNYALELNELVIHKINILVNGVIKLELKNGKTKNLNASYFSHSFVMIQDNDKFYLGDSWDITHYFNFRRKKTFDINSLTFIVEAIVERNNEVLDYFFNDDEDSNWVHHKDDECFEEYKVDELTSSKKFDDLTYSIKISTFLL